MRLFVIAMCAIHSHSFDEFQKRRTKKTAMKWFVITMIYFVIQKTILSFIVFVSFFFIIYRKTYRHDKSISFIVTRK